MQNELLTIKEASEWATGYIGKEVTPSNISCLLQYGRVKKKNADFGQLLEKQKINGIFSSPPYVGLIDYHEQHAYAYDLFGFERKDEDDLFGNDISFKK